MLYILQPSLESQKNSARPKIVVEMVCSQPIALVHTSPLHHNSLCGTRACELLCHIYHYEVEVLNIRQLEAWQGALEALGLLYFSAKSQQETALA